MTLRRKLVKNRDTLWVSLPKDLAANMQWKPGDFVHVSGKGYNQLLIERLINGNPRLQPRRKRSLI